MQQIYPIHLMLHMLMSEGVFFIFLSLKSFKKRSMGKSEVTIPFKTITIRPRRYHVYLSQMYLNSRLTPHFNILLGFSSKYDLV